MYSHEHACTHTCIYVSIYESIYVLLEKQDIIGNKIFNVNAIKDIHIFGIGVIAKDNDFLEVVQETDRKVF